MDWGENGRKSIYTPCVVPSNFSAVVAPMPRPTQPPVRNGTAEEYRLLSRGGYGTFHLRIIVWGGRLVETFICIMLYARPVNAMTAYEL